jgi:hypothetical protein
MLLALGALIAAVVGMALMAALERRPRPRLDPIVIRHTSPRPR